MYFTTGVLFLNTFDKPFYILECFTTEQSTVKAFLSVNYWAIHTPFIASLPSNKGNEVNFWRNTEMRSDSGKNLEILNFCFSPTKKVLKCIVNQLANMRTEAIRFENHT